MNLDINTANINHVDHLLFPTLFDICFDNLWSGYSSLVFSLSSLIFFLKGKPIVLIMLTCYRNVLHIWKLHKRGCVWLICFLLLKYVKNKLSWIPIAARPATASKKQFTVDRTDGSKLADHNDICSLKLTANGLTAKLANQISPTRLTTLVLRTTL